MRIINSKIFVQPVRRKWWQLWKPKISWASPFAPKVPVVFLDRVSIVFMRDGETLEEAHSRLEGEQTP